MKFNLLQSLRERFSANGAENEPKKVIPQETPYYSDSERASIKLHRMAAQEKAREAVKKADVKLHPRLAKARAAHG